MAYQAENRHVSDQLKVLTGLKLPGFNWKANNMRMEFDIFWQTLKLCSKAWRSQRKSGTSTFYGSLAERGWSDGMPALRVQWTKKIPLPSSMHSRKAYELAETYWMYRSLYLSSERQSKGEMAATLTTRVEDLVNMCQWPAVQN